MFGLARHECIDCNKQKAQQNKEQVQHQAVEQHFPPAQGINIEERIGIAVAAISQAGSKRHADKGIDEV